ncbi:hypothetical protein ILYODFUR_034202 [Ilyodon furcidens]|uniref:Ig-like domain-containing protein n=1 Tax=Ilyodon furcidens TaxID=33524 RepID=A0ABV0TS37_9TELE
MTSADFFSPADQRNITGKPGQNITLPCHDSAKDIITVEWKKRGLEPEYVLRYRNNHTDPESQHLSFKNRVYLQDRQIKDGNLSLVLENTTSNDTGTFNCEIRIKGSRGSKTIGIINLTVKSGYRGGSAQLAICLSVFSYFLLMVL